MACSCTKIARNADGQAFPTISTQYHLDNPQEATCCGEADSCASDGGVVPAALMDGTCANEGVTLLARLGSVVSRFTKSGFIELRNGKAYVVESFSVKLKELYHRRFQSAGKGLPVLGEPLDSAYDAVVDETGAVFGQKGLDTEDSVKIWNKDLALHTVIPISEFPKTHKGLLPYEDELELVGFVPIAADGSPSAVRNLSVLSGEGIIVFEKQATVASDCLCEGCQPVEAEASVARFLANPTGDGVYTLRFSVDDGVYWEED